MPIGPPNGFHQLMQYDVSEDEKVIAKHLGSVRFVPLTCRFYCQNDHPFCSLISHHTCTKEIPAYTEQVTGSNRGGISRVLEVDGSTKALVLPSIVPAPDSA